MMHHLPGDRPLGPRLGAALALLLLSLGLPWGVVGAESHYVPGWFNPGHCMLQADGYLWCTSGFASPGYLLAGPGAPMAGYASNARVSLAAAVGLIGWALYRRTTAPLGWAVGLTVAAVVLAGTALRPGAVAAILAVLLLLAERRQRVGFARTRR